MSPPTRRRSWWLLLAQWLSTVAAQSLPERGAARVVVLSDFNESYGSVRYSTHVDAAVARTIGLKPDLVISTGDMVAGQRLSPLLERGGRRRWSCAAPCSRSTRR